MRAGLDPVWILNNMTEVIAATAAPNFMLAEGQECSGALQAVNDMLVSSYTGVLRLFDSWPAAEDASFTSLRAKGGFTVSASLRGGIVAPVTVASEAGESCSMLSPWAAGLSVIDSAGRKVDAVNIGGGVWGWATTAGVVYTVSAAA